MTKHQSEPNAQPASEAVDVCVDSNQDVIRKFCDLESRVWHAVIEPINPRDCFCGHGQKLTVDPVLRFEDGYRHNLAAFRFIEAAAMKAVGEFQAMQQRHKSEADEFADQPPASEPSGRELPDSTGVWFRGGSTYIVRGQEFGHAMFATEVDVRGYQGSTIDVQKLPCGHWHPAAPAGEREEVGRLAAANVKLLADNLAMHAKLDAVAGLVAKIRNPRKWPGMTTEIRALIADELEAALAGK